MHTPLVSIITPCYNSAATIAQTIESVIAQTYGNWEMIIADDCSTDNTAEIINRYSKQDQRITYLRTDCPSGSPTLPRNMALKKANGDYIAMLDSDDAWMPNKLQEQITFALTNNYGFVYSNYEKMNEEGVRNNRIITLRPTSTYNDILKSNSIPCLTVLIKRQHLLNRCFRSVPNEDYVLWLEVLKQGIKAYNTGKIHAIYREQSTSRSSNKFATIQGQWYVLRQIEKIPFCRTLYFMTTYTLQGIRKYLT